MYLQAALHAAETNGIALIKAMREFLEKNDFPYNVTLVPFANPFAMDIKIGEYTYGRFDTKTGENWNRGFKNLLMPVCGLDKIDLQEFVVKYQNQGFDQLCQAFHKLLSKRLQVCIQHDIAPHEKLANTLHKLALDADFSFDLHCDSISVPYIYAPSYLKDKRLCHFISDYFIFTPNEPSGCFNQAIFYPWWQLITYWNELTGEEQQSPKHAFTYEMGNKETFDSKSAQNLLNGMIAYIQNNNIPETQDKKYGCQEADFFRVRASLGGIIEYDDAQLGKIHNKHVKLGSLHTQSSILGIQEAIEITLPIDAILLTRTSSATMHEGDEVFKVMSNYFKI